MHMIQDRTWVGEETHGTLRHILRLTSSLTVILMLIDFIIFCEMLIEHRFSYNDQNKL